MCGIFGAVTTSQFSLMSTRDAERCLLTMDHRGPDASGLESFNGPDASCILGHVRLSIIDLAGGRQPMSTVDTNVVLTFNGEIYNYVELKAQLASKGHKFSDNSDTEVLLHAYEEWGEDCVSRLRGMFAFAIWDAGKQYLFLARDHFGKKPLFYTEQNGVLFFASEIKALQAVPGLELTFNKEQLGNYAVYRYVPSPATFIREIEKLPAGSKLTWRNGKVEVHRYFKPPCAHTQKRSISAVSAVDEFWRILDEAVHLRMASDVPFGAFLSGGIDSSAVVALMHKHSSQKVKTFSIGFSEIEYSELEQAGLIARQFSTDHHELVVSQDDLMSVLPELVRYRDAPICEPSDIPIFMLAKEASKSVKMVLTGEGSDEILAGYPKHLYERLVPGYLKIPGLIRRSCIAPLISALPYGFRRAKTAIRNMNTERFDERMPGWFGALDERHVNSLIRLDNQLPLTALEFDSSQDSLNRILLFDQLSWLPDNLLERGDRMTMAASLEARMPFMDIELAKFVASLPNRYLIRCKTSKWVLRRAMQQVLPKSILDRPKVGFRVPVNMWFQTTMKDYLMEHLLGSNSLSNSFYEPLVLRSLVSEHIEGRVNHEKVLWMLLTLEIWLRENQSKINL